jgi:hypothetical protein
MAWKIEPKDGVEIYVSQNNKICLKQDIYGVGENLIVLDPSDVPKVREFLQAALDEFLNDYQTATEEQEEES